MITRSTGERSQPPGNTGTGRTKVRSRFGGPWNAVRGSQDTNKSAPSLLAGLLVVLSTLMLLSWTMVFDGSTGPGSAEEDEKQNVSEPEVTQSPGDGAQRPATLPDLWTELEPPTGQSALVANPLYDSGRLSPLPCPVSEVDVHDPGSMDEFLHGIADCLDQAWQAQFAQVGLPFEPPERVFWSEPGTSPCRPYPSTAGAFYCRAGQSIYIGTSDVVDKWNGATQSVVYASLLAHEYGHHVQGESGLLEYYHEQRRLEGEGGDPNSWTRRSELQANCLAGVFLGSVRLSYPLSDGDLEILLADAAATADREDGDEDERTHGSAENSVLWTEKGWEEQTPGACNTWDVEDEELVQ